MLASIIAGVMCMCMRNCVCVCVCVCEREREHTGEYIHVLATILKMRNVKQNCEITIEIHEISAISPCFRV
jgi:hypothetical protein